MSKQHRRKPRVQFDEENGVITGGAITNLRSLFSANVVQAMNKLIRDIFTAFARNELRGLTFLTTLPSKQDDNTQILRGYFRIANVEKEISSALLTESTFDIIVPKNRRKDVMIDEIEERNYKLGIPFLTSRQPTAFQVPKIHWNDYTGPAYVISTLVQQETPWRVEDMHLQYNGPDMPLLEIGVVIAPSENFKYPQNLNVRNLGTSKRVESKYGMITSIYSDKNRRIFSEYITFSANERITEEVDITERTTTADRIRSKREPRDSDSTIDLTMDTINLSED